MIYCDFLFNVCMEAKDWLNLWIAAFALLVSFFSLIVTVRYASKSFRPIVTACVKTHSGGNELIAYDLVLRNSGAIPARQIQIHVDQLTLVRALGSDANENNKRRWLACFAEGKQVALLQNGDTVACSFGTTRGENEGFWKYGALIAITIRYRGWFGRRYVEKQALHVLDSESFTGYFWG